MIFQVSLDINTQEHYLPEVYKWNLVNIFLEVRDKDLQKAIFPEILKSFFLLPKKDDCHHDCLLKEVKNILAALLIKIPDGKELSFQIHV